MTTIEITVPKVGKVKLCPFTYDNGRTGFLLERSDGTKTNLTVNIDSIQINRVLLKNWGTADVVHINEHLVNEGKFEVCEIAPVGLNTAWVTRLINK